MNYFQKRHQCFFFDEIQVIPGFEKGLKYLLNRGYPIFISGSSAQLSAHELASVLRGKALEIPLLPLNFKEFLLFKGHTIKRHYSTKERGALYQHLGDFLQWGGFPEVVLSEKEITKRNLIKSYIDSMLFRDIVERQNLANTFLVDKLFYKLAASFTKQISVNKWYNDFKSEGLKISKDTLYQYLKYFEETRYIYLLENACGGRTSLKKVYLVDNGIYQCARGFSPDYGKLFENQIFRDCLLTGHSVAFLGKDDCKTDFLVKEQAIQACYSLNDKNFEREIKGALYALKRKHIKRGIIAVASDERYERRAQDMAGVSVFHYAAILHTPFA